MNADPPSPSKRPRRGDSLIGCVLADKYRIQSLIAAGGMGKVYKGEQVALGRPVAVKVVAPLIDPEDSQRQTAEFRARFLLEASTLAKLQHLNIVTIFDYGATTVGGERRFFMVMEYIEGRTLTDALKERAPLTENETLDLAVDIARGLREAHRQGVVHRDLKPSNIMLARIDGSDSCKLLDFGLVKVMSQEGPGITKTGVFLGSPTYISPEQVEQKPVDDRTDIYSLGIIMYLCLTGRPPFEGSTMELLSAHANEEPPRMSDANPAVQVATQVEEFVLSCLAKDPDHRPSSADDFLDRLRSSSLRYMPSSSKRLRKASHSPSPIRVKVSNSSVRPPSSGREPASKREPSGGRPVSSSRQRAGVAAHTPTPSPVAVTPVPPPAQDKPGSGRRLWLMAATGFGVTLALGILAILSLGPKPSDGMVLAEISSTPRGAEVWQGNKKLGLTPLRLQLAPRMVGKSGELFTLKHQGYQPFTFRVPGNQPTAKIHAKLTAK